MIIMGQYIILHRLLFCGIALCFAGTAAAQHHQGIPSVGVSPADELTVLDPASNSEPKPTPIVYQVPGAGQRVDIPPTVIIHNFYYSGDRDFRGPWLPGGPSILVVNHPLTAERQYLEVQMLPGSPRITYRKHYIDYDFGESRIRVRFLHPLKPHACPTVNYVHGKNFKDTVGSHASATGGHFVQWTKRTGVPHAVKHVAHGTVELLDTSADRIRQAGTIAVTPAIRIMESTPIGGLLVSSPEEQAARERDREVQEAQRQNEIEDITIRTLR